MLISVAVVAAFFVSGCQPWQPDSVLWCVRNDGQLAALTHRRSQEVVDRARRKIDGSFSGGDGCARTR